MPQMDVWSRMTASTHNSEAKGTVSTMKEFIALWVTDWAGQKKGRPSSPAQSHNHLRRRSGRSPALPYPARGQRILYHEPTMNDKNRGRQTSFFAP